jgi:hypothetical protein
MVDLRTLLAAAGVPMPVVDGPEQTASVVTPRERIVVEMLDEEHPLLPPKGANTRNPIHVRDLEIPAKVTIYAQDPRAGALHHEHITRAVKVLRSVVAALHQVLVAGKHGSKIGNPKPVKLEDTKGTPVTNFFAYEVPFFVRTSVEVRTWAGSAAEEGGAFTATTIASTTVVGLEGETPTETGCGA